MDSKANNIEQMKTKIADSILFLLCAGMLYAWVHLCVMIAFHHPFDTKEMKYGIEVYKDDEDDFSGGCQK